MPIPHRPQINLSLDVAYQQPDALVLAVAHDLLPAKVRLLEQKSLTITDWRFTFAIIGESHLVTVEHNNQLVLQEMLACVTLPAASCTHQHSFSDLCDHDYRDTRYAVAVRFTPTPPWNVPSQRPDTTLEMAFPQVHDQVPVTRIQWQRRGKTVLWWTLHVYPGAETITHVHSHSQFRLE